jgi:hypothetical protein
MIESLAVGDRVLGVGVTGGLPEDERRVAAVLHTFARGSDHVRVLDIGDEEIRTTDEHPFFVMGRGFIKAGELQPGDRLVALSGTRVVVSSTRIEGSFAVFNIEVDGVNDYFVSSAGVLVHNKQAPPPPQPPDP